MSHHESSKSSILKLGNLGCYDLPLTKDKAVFLGLKLLWPAASRRPSAMDGNTCRSRLSVLHYASKTHREMET